jgi:hypothetical protein
MLMISFTYIQSASVGTLGYRKLICFTARLTNTVRLDFHCSFVCLSIFVQDRRWVYFQCKSPKFSFFINLFRYFFLKISFTFSKDLLHSCTKQTNIYFTAAQRRSRLSNELKDSINTQILRPLICCHTKFRTSNSVSNYRCNNEN